MSTRKPRSDSKLLNLPEEEQVKAFDAVKRLGYTKARLWIAEEIKMKVSTGALHAAYQHWSRKDSEERILRNITAANDTVDALSGHLPLLNKATQAALYQATFEAIQSGADPKLVKDFSNILLKSRALDQADQSLDLRLREFEQKIADAQGMLDKAKKTGGMTPEAIEQMEEALGLL